MPTGPFQPLQQNHPPPGSNAPYSYRSYSSLKREQDHHVKEVHPRALESRWMWSPILCPSSTPNPDEVWGHAFIFESTKTIFQHQTSACVFPLSKPRSKAQANQSQCEAIDHPLPPPPFSGRQMPPPSSPQGSHPQLNAQASIIRGPPPPPPPPPPPSSGGREIPSLPPTHRPGSSMSISSMLGADTSRPNREPAPTNNAKKPSSKPATALSSQSWQTAVSSPPRVNDPVGLQYQKSQSPERTKISLAPTTRTSRAYSGGAPRRSLSSAAMDTSEPSRIGLSSASLTPQFSPKSDSGVQQDWKRFPDRYPGPGRSVERPNSQPNGYSTPPHNVEETTNVRPSTSETAAIQRAQNAPRFFSGSRILEGMNNKGPSVRADSATRDYPDHRGQRAQERPLSGSTVQASPAQGRINTSSYPFLSRTSNTSESQSSRNRADIDLLANRILERDQSHLGPTQPPFSSESLRRLREEKLVAAGAHQQVVPSNQQARPVGQADEQHAQTHSRGQPSTVPSIDGLSLGKHLGPPARPEEESLQNHRGSLSLLFDNNRRGRISPLPQAVQGAQARLSGPASDPGIKNEFGKMFVGLGSGVGSAGKVGSGASTPRPLSPTRNLDIERRTPLSSRADLAKLTKPRTSSRVGRTRRKATDEEPTQDPEIVEIPSTIGLPGARGGKKSRHSHHHHQHLHQ